MTEFKHTFDYETSESFLDPQTGKEVWRPALAYPFFVGFGLRKAKCGCGRKFKHLEDYHAHYIYMAVWENESGYLNRVVADAQKQATLKQAVEAYELKPGNHYLIEVDNHMVPQSDLFEVAKSFYDREIHLTFIATRGGKALRPIPGKEEKK